MDKEALLKHIGNRIKEIRTASQVTQQELAALCDFEKSNMSRIETGKSNFTVGTLLKIATALNVQVSDLIN